MDLTINELAEALKETAIKESKLTKEWEVIEAKRREVHVEHTQLKWKLFHKEYRIA